MIEGQWSPATPARLPIIPGHEVVGEVVEIGAGVTALATGDRVGVRPPWSTCGRCEHCLAGVEQRCRQRQITGEHRDGGYAELMLADAAHTFPIPDNLGDTEAAPLLCPGITAYGSVKKAALSPGQRVGVLGVGGVGHVVVQMAALTGARWLPSAAARLTEAWLSSSAPMRRTPFDAGVLSLPDESLDAAIVFAPSPDAVAEAVRVTKPGARIVLGVSQPLAPLDVGDEKTILTSVLGNRWDMRQVLGMASDGKIRIVHSDHPLTESNKVLQQLKAGKIRARAVLVP